MENKRLVYCMFPWLLVWGTHAAAHDLATVAPPAPALHFRQPVALVVSGNRLFVANRRGGSLSRIDTRTLDVLSEKTIGQSVSDLALWGGDRLLAIDEVAGQAVVLREHSGQVWIDRRIDVATSPVSVVVSPDTEIASVASLWARRLTMLRTRGDRIETDGTVDLPFAPRLQCFLPHDDRLVVADAFGGLLAIVDTESKRLVAVRSIDAHNIRGLTISQDGQRLLIVHQMLTGSVPTTRQRVFWGQVISNLLRSVSLEELLDGGARAEGTEMLVRPIAHWSLEPLGETKNAAGDPGAILASAWRRNVICLSGVHQIGITRDDVSDMQRIEVGQRPLALAMDLHQPRVFVANAHDDSISVVDVNLQEVVKTINLGRTPEPSIADRGERLFYDARLTLDGWYSCHSCHTDGHSNGQLNDNFGDDEIGTPKRVLSLLGVNSSGPWGWKGQQLWVNTQVVKSLRTTMQHDGVENLAVDGDVGAITDYLRSFQPPPSLLVARGKPLDTPQIARGREIFASFHCGRCHAPPVYTTAEVYDVGLEDEAGQTEFNPPSLRGVSQRSAWLHDNRAQRLSDVFTSFGHPNESTLDLSADDVAALVQFLQTL